jgi:hypothetical protein
MTLDTTPETWAAVARRECPTCGGALELEHLHTTSPEGIAIARCTGGCQQRWGVYLSGDGHGVEKLPE